MKYELVKNIIEWGSNKGILSEEKIGRRKAINPQWLKLIEELGKLAEAINKHDINLIKDAVGDCLVAFILLLYLNDKNEYFICQQNAIEPKNEKTLDKLAWAVQFAATHRVFDIGFDDKNKFLAIIDEISETYNFTSEEALQSAYDVISKRTGKMVNGVFIKDKS